MRVTVRHYAVSANLTGVNRTIRRIVQAKIPNLGKLEDISDYILGGNPLNAEGEGGASDSEGEDEMSKVVLPSGSGSGSGSGRGSGVKKSALKLVEIGPRLTLVLNKVERGLAAGDVMFHAYRTKSKEAALESKRRVLDEASLKEGRRRVQEGNVERKKGEKERKREERERKRARFNAEGEGGGGGGRDSDSDSDSDSGSEGGNRSGSDDDERSREIGTSAVVANKVK